MNHGSPPRRTPFAPQQSQQKSHIFGLPQQAERPDLKLRVALFLLSPLGSTCNAFAKQGQCPASTRSAEDHRGTACILRTTRCQILQEEGLTLAPPSNKLASRGLPFIAITDARRLKKGLQLTLFRAAQGLNDPLTEKIIDPICPTLTCRQRRK
jgi:hypothetical protein